MKLNEKPNLTYDKINSITKLKNNRILTIKPADKGNFTILMDTDDYLTEAYRQLNDTSYCRQLSRSIYTVYR